MNFQLNDHPNKSQNLKEIKALFEAGKTLTVVSVLRDVGTIELRHYVAVLRKDMEIKDKWVKRNGKRFKEYWLRKEVKNG